MGGSNIDTVSEGRQTIARVQRKLSSVKNATKKAFKEGLKEAGEFLKKEALFLVPTQTGKLARSVFVRIDTNGNEISVLVGFRDKKAIWVHERKDLAHGEAFNRKHAHRIKASGGKDPVYFPRRPQERYKFLSHPARKNRSTLRKIVSTHIKNSIRKK